MINISILLTFLIITSMTMPSYAVNIYLPSHNADISIGGEDRCFLPKDKGLGHAYIPSFYYDAEQNACLPFIFGGGRGNANRFKSIYQCESVCMMNEV
nr:hypothetical transcript [Hymenolepis microstoma]